MVMQFKYCSSTNRMINEFLIVNLNTREFMYYTYEDLCKSRLVQQLIDKVSTEENEIKGEFNGKETPLTVINDYDLKYRPSMAQMVEQFRNDPTFAELKY